MKKHVIITPNGRGGMDIQVDGTNVSQFVADTGIAVEFDHGTAYVTLPVVPAMFSGDFPEAVVNALSGTEGLNYTLHELSLVVQMMEEVRAARGLTRAESDLREQMHAVLARAGVQARS